MAVRLTRRWLWIVAGAVALALACAAVSLLVGRGSEPAIARVVSVRSSGTGVIVCASADGRKTCGWVDDADARAQLDVGSCASVDREGGPDGWLEPRSCSG